MNTVSPLAVAYCRNLSFNFTNTLKEEQINYDDYMDYTFLIDVDGLVYQMNEANEMSAGIVIVGGVNKFVNEKMERTVSNFFLTEPQKVVLYQIMKELSKYTDSAQITSDNDKLQQSLYALYKNYCG